jgi:hypothetical protein
VETFASTLPNSMTNTGLALYVGPCEGPLTLLACDDNSGEGNFSLITVTGLTEGDQVLARVWAFNGIEKKQRYNRHQKQQP